MFRSHVIAVFLGLLISWPAQPAEIVYRQKVNPLYPVILDRFPDTPSPLLLPDGTEVVLGVTVDGRAALIRVTVENGAEYVYARAGKGRQLEVDGTDFPTLARTGLHSEIELDQVWTITGRSVAEITEIGRPGRSSGAGFMAADEDVVSVLRGDNRIVRALGLTHPELARPLFHVWNSILEQLAAIRGHGRSWGEIPRIRYHGKEVHIEWNVTKGWQESIFDDEIFGGRHVYIARSPDAEEEALLKARHPDLPPGEMDELVARLSRFHISEMVPFYVMRYGFYEGHTDYRADPVAIAFVFGLRPLEEIDAAFGADLAGTLTRHFTSAGLVAEGSDE